MQNKGADQMHGDRAADQRLCFRYINNSIHLLSKPKFSSLKTSSVAVQPSLCQKWSGISKTDFLTKQLILDLTFSSVCFN